MSWSQKREASNLESSNTFLEKFVKAGRETQLFAWRGLSFCHLAASRLAGRDLACYKMDGLWWLPWTDASLVAGAGQSVNHLAVVVNNTEIQLHSCWRYGALMWDSSCWDVLWMFTRYAMKNNMARPGPAIISDQCDGWKMVQTQITYCWLLTSHRDKCHKHSALLGSTTKLVKCLAIHNTLI